MTVIFTILALVSVASASPFQQYQQHVPQNLLWPTFMLGNQDGQQRQQQQQPEVQQVGPARFLNMPNIVNMWNQQPSNPVPQPPQPQAQQPQLFNPPILAPTAPIEEINPAESEDVDFINGFVDMAKFPMGFQPQSMQEYTMAGSTPFVNAPVPAEAPAEPAATEEESEESDDVAETDMPAFLPFNFDMAGDNYWFTQPRQSQQWMMAPSNVQQQNNQFIPSNVIPRIGNPPVVGNMQRKN